MCDWFQQSVMVIVASWPFRFLGSRARPGFPVRCLLKAALDCGSQGFSVRVYFGPLVLSGTSLPAHLPQPCTVRYLVSCYLDISCVPRRSFFQLLSSFSPNELEREKLQEFSSAQGQEELYAYCNRPRRTTLEVGWCQEPSVGSGILRV